MTSVFQKCQETEEIRLRFFKDVLFSIHKVLNLSENPRWVTMKFCRFESLSIDCVNLLFCPHSLISALPLHSLPQIYDEFYHTINNADHNKDLKWWSNNHGVIAIESAAQGQLALIKCDLFCRWTWRWDGPYLLWVLVAKRYRFFLSTLH